MLAGAAWADSILRAMPVRDRIAQLVWPFVLGDYVPEGSAEWARIRRLVTEQKVGGFIVSVGSPIDIAVKVNALQALSELPLLISADLETGVGFRARGGYFLPNAIDLGGATSFPWQMALGAARDTTLAYQMAAATAREARALGVHVAFGPVLDVNNNPANPVIGARSYSEDPALTARLGAAFVRGLQDHGVLATGKHFPGHGDTETNSHLALASVTASRARLDSVELVPFRAAVRAGVGAIMTFHGFLPALHASRLDKAPPDMRPANQTFDPLGLRQLVIAVITVGHQITLIALRRRLCGTHRLLHGGQHAPAFAEEHLAGPGQPRQACAAVEQLHAKLAFQVAHRTRHRRLLDAQTLGCTGQMQFFRNCDEVTQQSEIQGHLLFVFFWFGLLGASISIRIPSAPPSMASLRSTHACLEQSRRRHARNRPAHTARAWNADGQCAASATLVNQPVCRARAQARTRAGVRDRCSRRRHAGVRAGVPMQFHGGVFRLTPVMAWSVTKLSSNTPDFCVAAIPWATRS